MFPAPPGISSFAKYAYVYPDPAVVTVTAVTPPEAVVTVQTPPEPSPRMAIDAVVALL